MVYWNLLTIQEFLPALLLMRFSARTRIAKKNKTNKQTKKQTNKHTVDTAITFFIQCLHYLYYLFIIEHSVLIVLLQRSVRTGNDAKNPEILHCYQKNPVICNACVTSQKIAIECGIAFSEIHLFLINISRDMARKHFKK